MSAELRALLHYGSEVIAGLPAQSQAAFSAALHPSLNRPDDKYDDLGRNVSAQKRRQDAEPWAVVSYKRSRSYHEDEDEENEE